MVFIFCSTSFKDKIDTLLLEVNSMVCAILISCSVVFNVGRSCDFNYILFNTLLCFLINALICIPAFIYGVFRMCNKKEG